MFLIKITLNSDFSTLSCFSNEHWSIRYQNILDWLRPTTMHYGLVHSSLKYLVSSVSCSERNFHPSNLFLEMLYIHRIWWWGSLTESSNIFSAEILSSLAIFRIGFLRELYEFISSCVAMCVLLCGYVNVNSGAQGDQWYQICLQMLWHWESYGSWEAHFLPLQEQQIGLTSEPFLQFCFVRFNLKKSSLFSYQITSTFDFLVREWIILIANRACNHFASKHFSNKHSFKLFLNIPIRSFT